MELRYGDVIEYALVSFTAAALVLGAVTLDSMLIAVSSAAALASLIILKMWPIIESLVIKRTNIVQVLNGFELGGDREAAVAMTDVGYTATCAADIESFSGVSLGKERLEAVIAHTGAPFRFSIQVERLDTREVMEGLETQKHMREIAISRLPNQGSGKATMKMQRLKNEISRIEHDISALGAGLPLRLAAYVMTSAAAQGRLAANNAAKAQIRAIVSELEAVGISCRILTGSELLSLLRFDSSVAK